MNFPSSLLKVKPHSSLSTFKALPSVTCAVMEQKIRPAVKTLNMLTISVFYRCPPDCCHQKPWQNSYLSFNDVG